MSETSDKTSRGPMIHIRLDEDIHRLLKIHVAQTGTTIQQLVKDLIDRKVVKLKGKPNKK